MTATAGETHALHCDEYLLTMSQSFWRHGEDQRASFELFVRELPPSRGYLVVAGVEPALEYLRDLRFTPEQLEWLAARQGHDPKFVEHLAGLRFTGDVDALPEGTVVSAGVPLVRISARRVEATLVEAALLAIVNHETMVASKTARVVEAARGRQVWDFSLRRLHGVDAGLGVARASYIAGAAGTATVVAGQRYGIPVTGTMAHQYVLRFGPDGEQQAFEQFLCDYPERSTMLVDTFDTLRGVRRAIAASQATGIGLAGVRLDSGDIVSLSREARRLLDSAGMPATRIVASGDLDEERIDALLRAGAPVDVFGVGTRLGTSYDAPALGGVYKLVAQDSGDGVMQPVMKWSTGKITDPGEHQVWRQRGCDVIGLVDERCEGEPLMRPLVRGGERISESEPLQVMRERCLRERESLPAETRRLVEPHPRPVERSAALMELRHRLGEAAVG